MLDRSRRVPLYAYIVTAWFVSSTAAQRIEACQNSSIGDDCTFPGSLNAIQRGYCMRLGPANHSVLVCTVERSIGDPECNTGLLHSSSGACCPRVCGLCRHIGKDAALNGMSESCVADYVVRLGKPCAQARPPCIMPLAQSSPNNGGQLRAQDGTSVETGATVDSARTRLFNPPTDRTENDEVESDSAILDFAELGVPLSIGFVVCTSVLCMVCLCCFFLKRIQAEGDPTEELGPSRSSTARKQQREQKPDVLSVDNLARLNMENARLEKMHEDLVDEDASFDWLYASAEQQWGNGASSSTTLQASALSGEEAHLRDCLNDAPPLTEKRKKGKRRIRLVRRKKNAEPDADGTRDAEPERTLLKSGATRSSKGKRQKNTQAPGAPPKEQLDAIAEHDDTLPPESMIILDIEPDLPKLDQILSTVKQMPAEQLRGLTPRRLHLGLKQADELHSPQASSRIRASPPPAPPSPSRRQLVEQSAADENLEDGSQSPAHYSNSERCPAWFEKWDAMQADLAATLEDDEPDHVVLSIPQARLSHC